MILDAANKMNVDVPTLCFLKMEELAVNNMAASCRLCVVEWKAERILLLPVQHRLPMVW